MKKVLIILLALTLVGCSGKKNNTPEEKTTTKQEEAYRSANTDNSKATQLSQTPEKTSKTALRQLKTDSSEMQCCTDKGFYYLAGFEDADRNYYYSIRYIDFATKQEVYLCNRPECKHTDDTCNAFVTEECGRLVLFTDNKYLYLLQTGIDGEGSVERKLIIDGDAEYTYETPKAFLYRMNLDGTDGKKVYEFEQGEVVTPEIFADDENLYFYTKTLNEKKVDNQTDNTTAEQKRVVRIALSDYSSEEIMEVGKEQQVIGCAGEYLVLLQEHFDSKQQLPMIEDNDELDKVMKTEVDTVTKYNIATNKESDVVKLKEKGKKTVYLEQGTLCYGVGGAGKIMGVDIASGKSKLVAKTTYEKIVYHYGNYLVCDSYSKDNLGKSVIIDLADGTVQNWKVNGKGGYPVLIVGENEKYFVVTTDITENGKATFALLAKKDFKTQRANYLQIAMLKDKGDFIS